MEGKIKALLIGRNGNLEAPHTSVGIQTKAEADGLEIEYQRYSSTPDSAQSPRSDDNARPKEEDPNIRSNRMDFILQQGMLAGSESEIVIERDSGQCRGETNQHIGCSAVQRSTELDTAPVVVESVTGLLAGSAGCGGGDGASTTSGEDRTENDSYDDKEVDMSEAEVNVLNHPLQGGKRGAIGDWSEVVLDAGDRLVGWGCKLILPGRGGGRDQWTVRNVCGRQARGKLVWWGAILGLGILIVGVSLAYNTSMANQATEGFFSDKYPAEWMHYLTHHCNDL
jgi:hypothetical protein